MPDKLREKMKSSAKKLLDDRKASGGYTQELIGLIEVCAYMHDRIQGTNGGDLATNFVANQLPKEGLVCFRSVVYAAFQALNLDATGSEIRELERLTTVGPKGAGDPQAYLNLLGREDPIEPKTDDGPPAGSAVFFKSPMPELYGHVALSVGGACVMSCNTPIEQFNAAFKDKYGDLGVLTAQRRAVLAPYQLVVDLCGPAYDVIWSKKPFWEYYLRKR